MRKYILSFLVIGTFGLYALYLRIGGNAVGSILSNTTPSPTSVPAAPLVVQPKPPTTHKTPTPIAPVQTGQYRDGTYTGVSANAYYGNIQVQAVIQGGKLAGVQFLDYPQDRSRSISINTRAMPILQSEAIQAQSANVNTISGATDSSGAFRQSLSSALAQALNS